MQPRHSLHVGPTAGATRPVASALQLLSKALKSNRDGMLRQGQVGGQGAVDRVAPRPVMGSAVPTPPPAVVSFTAVQSERDDVRRNRQVVEQGAAQVASAATCRCGIHSIGVQPRWRAPNRQVIDQGAAERGWATTGHGLGGVATVAGNGAFPRGVGRCSAGGAAAIPLMPGHGPRVARC